MKYVSFAAPLVCLRLSGVKVNADAVAIQWPLALAFATGCKCETSLTHY